MSSVPLRLGLLSTAKINNAVIAGARASGDVEIVGVASRERGRAETYAREHEIPAAYGGYDALLGASDIDAVYISLPNSLHVEWSTRALRSGKHVLCEKPLGRRAEEVEEAFDVAESEGLLLMEGFMYRHHPQTDMLSSVVVDGSIGSLRQIRAAFAFLLDDPENIRLRPELEGGALMDLGCYCVNATRLLAGEPELVVGRQVIGRTGVDVRFAALLHFRNDVIAELHCAFDLPYESRLEVFASAGSVLVREPWLCRDPHLELRRDGEVERIEVDDADRYRLELENFAAAVRGEARPLLDRADGVGQARTLEALYRSAASGEVVGLAR